MAGPISGFGGLNLPGTLTVALLTEGATALTTVRGSSEGPFILVNHQRVPLDAGKAAPGDLVRVTRLPDDTGPRFAIAREAQPPSPTVADALPQLLSRLSQAAGRPLPETLVPPGFPANAESVRQLVALFQQGNALGPQVERLATLLRAAKLDQPAAQALTQLLSQLGNLQHASPEQLAAYLKAQVQRRAPEAALINASQDELEALGADDLATAIRRFLADPELQEVLKATPQGKELLAAADSILDALDGARAQQLHGPRNGYAFLELPLPVETGFHHAAVHFYQEGDARASGGEELPSVAVLDLSLTNLGPLWISVRAYAGTCSCNVQAASPDAADALSAATPEIEAGLRAAGYAQATVRVGAWNGDRMESTAALLGRMRPLDLSA